MTDLEKRLRAELQEARWHYYHAADIESKYIARQTVSYIESFLIERGFISIS